MRQIFLVIILFSGLIMDGQFRRNSSKVENLPGVDDQPFSWGYYLGLNYFTYTLHPTKDIGLNEYQRFTVNVIPKTGFSVGFIAKWRINKYLDFRVEPGIDFVQRDLRFQHIKSLVGTEYDISADETYTIQATDTVRTIKSNYLNIPVFINLHGDRWYNTRPYFQAGVGWAINLASNEKKLDDNLDGIFRTKTHNFNWQVEAGIDIYFKRFKLTPAVRGIFFFNNELVQDNDGTPPLWAGSLESMSTRAIMFSLKFE